MRMCSRVKRKRKKGLIEGALRRRSGRQIRVMTSYD